MLPARELVDLRAEANLARPDACTIQVATQVNTKGSVETVYADTYTNVPCRLASANTQSVEKELGAALAAVSSHVLTVAFDQPAAPSNRVIHAGVTYEITACANATASWRTVRRVYLKRVE